jgi:hypothetical protein
MEKSMANVQKQFNQYHDSIKLSDEKEILKEKRDKLKENLESNLSKNEDAPKIDKYLLQGSYAIHTGINPPHYFENPNHDYDIDVGVVFDCTCDDYQPMELKEMVRDALNHPSRDLVIKTPCITVQYIKNGKKDYHVDMPVYVKRTDGNGYDLASGKNSSSDDWKHSDPEGLVKKINTISDDENERAQFRRIVKYLKCWKSKKFTFFNIPSIGITLGVWKEMAFSIDYYDNKPNDLIAMRDTIQRMLNQFYSVDIDENNELLYRYEVLLPVIPENDVFEKLTPKQMTELKTKLEVLKNDLDSAINEERVEKACEILTKQFDGFPIPTKEETARTSVRSINNTGSSS